MSRVVTATELQSVLEDYTIRLTGSEAPIEHSPIEDTSTNPPNWPADHRRVPKYRAVDRNRDVEGRPNGSNIVEQGFLTIMFAGVVLNATAAKVWGATGGPFFPGLFRYAIGGEW